MHNRVIKVLQETKLIEVFLSSHPVHVFTWLFCFDNRVSMSQSLAADVGLGGSSHTADGVTRKNSSNSS